MTLIASVHLTGGSDPAYAQRIRAGRHEFIADEPVVLGGHDAGPAPFQLLAASLAACTSITLAMYAARKGWMLGTLGIQVRIFEEQAVRRVERMIAFDAGVTVEQRARLLEIADKTPVTKVLRGGISIETTSTTL
jgi:putative redox protein